MGIKINGLKEFQSDVLKLNDIDKEEILNRVIKKLQEKMKNEAPKDTGRLKDSIKAKVKDGVGVVYSSLDYAWMLEYGTKYLTKHVGWWSGTVEDIEAELLKEMENEIFKNLGGS